jgi:hypothetical protein
MTSKTAIRRTGECGDGAWLSPAFAQMHRVLNRDAFCVSFYGWHQIDLFSTIQMAIASPDLVQRLAPPFSLRQNFVETTTRRDRIALVNAVLRLETSREVEASNTRHGVLMGRELLVPKCDWGQETATGVCGSDLPRVDSRQLSQAI